MIDGMGAPRDPPTIIASPIRLRRMGHPPNHRLPHLHRRWAIPQPRAAGPHLSIPDARIVLRFLFVTRTISYRFLRNLGNSSSVLHNTRACGDQRLDVKSQSQEPSPYPLLCEGRGVERTGTRPNAKFRTAARTRSFVRHRRTQDDSPKADFAQACPELRRDDKRSLTPSGSSPPLTTHAGLTHRQL